MTCLLTTDSPQIREQADQVGLGYFNAGEGKVYFPNRNKIKTQGKYPWERKYPLKPEALGGRGGAFSHCSPNSSNMDSFGPVSPLATPGFSPSNSLTGSTGLCKTYLWAVNEAVIPIYPMVPNPYTLLTQLPGDAQYFSVLDLKDAFFCIPLYPDSQFLFASEWKDTDTLEDTQYSWRMLPQGFWDSPHFSGNVLAKELGN